MSDWGFMRDLKKWHNAIADAELEAALSAVYVASILPIRKFRGSTHRELFNHCARHAGLFLLSYLEVIAKHLKEQGNKAEVVNLSLVFREYGRTFQLDPWDCGFRFDFKNFVQMVYGRGDRW